jgi:hypothetical protein
VATVMLFFSPRISISQKPRNSRFDRSRKTQPQRVMSACFRDPKHKSSRTTTAGFFLEARFLKRVVFGVRAWFRTRLYIRRYSLFLKFSKYLPAHDMPFLWPSLLEKPRTSTYVVLTVSSKNVLAPSRWLGTSSSPRSRRFEIVWYGCYGSRKTGSSNLLLFPGRSKSLLIYRKSRCPLSGLRSSECNRGKHMGSWCGSKSH